MHHTADWVWHPSTPGEEQLHIHGQPTSYYLTPAPGEHWELRDRRSDPNAPEVKSFASKEAATQWVRQGGLRWSERARE
jgi:hypothetical protein